MTTDAETLKARSRHLRGTLAAELSDDTAGAFSTEATSLLKFHGVYQQDDRDTRRDRTRAKEPLDHSCMVRVAIPGGRVTAEQYLAMDALADTVGADSLRVTTRQGVQYHFVAKGDLRPLVRGIGRSLLTTFAACGDVVRNVMVSPAPLPGRAHAELHATGQRLAAHFRPQTDAYAELFVDGDRAASVEREPASGHPADTGHPADAEPIYGHAYLPRKFKIAVAAPGDNGVDVFTNDVGLVPTVVDDRVVRWTVLVGGGLGMTHDRPETYPRLASGLADVDPGELVDVVEAVVAVQRDHGDRTNRRQARLKYLLDRWGLDRFRGEVEARLGRRLEPPTPHRFDAVADHLGWHVQDGGGWFLGVPVPSGRIRDTDAGRHRSALRAVVGRFGPEVRFTPQQDVLLCGIADDDRPAVEALLADHGVAPVGDLTPVERHAMACPALPTCSQALGEAERVLPRVNAAVVGVLAALDLAGEELHLRLTGCPNGCARPYATELGIVGRTKTKYDLFLGGSAVGDRLGRRFGGSIRLDELADTLRPVLTAWRDDRLAGEPFGDFCHRLGVEGLPTGTEALTGT